MAKREKPKDKKGKRAADPADVVDAVRHAVERTFHATAEQAQPARERGRSLLDEVASAAQRIRESFDDLRVLEDVRGLRAEIEALSRRVAALEQRSAGAQAGGQAPAAGETPAASATAAKKPAARKPAGTRSSAQRATSAAKTGTATRARATRSAPAKPGGAAKRPAAAKSPAKPVPKPPAGGS
jgi:hypothetical protein